MNEAGNEIRKLMFAWKEYLTDNISFAIKNIRKRKGSRLITVVLLAALMIWLIKNKAYAQGSNLLGDESYYFSLGRIISWIMGGGLLGMILRFARREYVKIKRFVDLAASCVLLIICAPLFVIITLLVKIDSEGPVFFRQVRLGRNGKRFRMFKFRTMRENAELETGPVWADDSDPRVTKIGYFLRKSHLDELPQLINVFCGDMSLIGPRPERPEMTDLITNHVPAFKERLNIRGGTIIVLEPETGKVLALANFPDFDPNRYQEEKLGIFQNSAIQRIFEPGSVFKSITMAAALEEGKITPQTTYQDPGVIEVGGWPIYNYDRRVYPGETSMTEVLEKSINTGAVFAEKQIGHKVFLDYIKRFGIFEKTGIDLQGESISPNTELKKGYEASFVTASFGQGIGMTPVQLIRAFCAIANGGKLVKPHLVEKIKISDNKIIEIENNNVSIDFFKEIDIQKIDEYNSKLKIQRNAIEQKYSGIKKIWV